MGERSELRPKVSIIVPVYNSERWLPSCINSVLKQSEESWELLLVDDGSRDGSLLVCRDYEKTDSRIRTFHQENGGVSSARNRGLKESQGEWVTFIDSDDWVDRDYLKHLLEDGTADLKMSLYWLENSDGTSSCRQFRMKFKEKLTLEESLIQSSILLWNICGKLYRKDIIMNFDLRFSEELSMGEDTIFNYSYLAKAESCILCNSFDYHYRQTNQSSLSKKNQYYDNLVLFISEAEMLVELFFNRGIDFSYNRAVLRAFSLRILFNLKRNKRKIKEVLSSPFMCQNINIRKNFGRKVMIFDIFLKSGFYLTAYNFFKLVKGRIITPTPAQII